MKDKRTVPLSSTIIVKRNTGQFALAARTARVFIDETSQEIMSLRPSETKKIKLDITEACHVYCTLSNGKSDTIEIKPFSTTRLEITLAFGGLGLTQEVFLNVVDTL